jgi:Arc/MetJ family transcription regulator
MLFYVYSTERRLSMGRTNIELDEKLVSEAMKLTKKKTKKDLVNYAVEELVRKLKRKKMLELEGKVEWTGKLDETRKNRT